MLETLIEIMRNKQTSEHHYRVISQDDNGYYMWVFFTHGCCSIIVDRERGLFILDHPKLYFKTEQDLVIAVGEMYDYVNKWESK